MKKSTRNWLIAGGAAAVAGGVGYYFYVKSKPAVPVAQLTPGTPVTTFTTGTKYAFVAPTPAGITDAASLTTALQGAGWANVAVPFFNGAGVNPIVGAPVSAGGYGATGVWNGANGTAVPSGVVAVVTA